MTSCHAHAGQTPIESGIGYATPCDGPPLHSVYANLSISVAVHDCDSLTICRAVHAVAFDVIVMSHLLCLVTLRPLSRKL